MIHIADSFRELLKSGDRSYTNKLIITLADGTVLDSITHEKILIGGIDKDNSVSDDNSFSALGSAVINSLSIIIDNRSGIYTNYNFTNATVVYKIEKIINNIGEPYTIGTYTVDETRYNGFSIILDCLDYMEKFDRPYETGIVYPTFAINVIREACTRCGVVLNETRSDFPPLTVVVQKVEDDAVTYRDIIAAIAQIHGLFAYCTPNGKLDFGWFDRAYLETLIDEIDDNTFDPEDIDLTKCHYIESLYTQDISVDEVQITGIKINVANEDDSEITTYTRGTDDYVISIENNPFIKNTNANIIADRIAPILIGLRFRPCNITHVNDFTMEAGDIAIIKDRKNNYYPILITRTNFKVGAQQSTICAAETPSRNSSTIYSQYTKNIVRNNNLITQEKTQRELQYNYLIEQLADANGLYMSTGVSPGGGVVYYLHNKQDKDDSDIIWKMTADAFAVSSDGGQTWNAGLTVDGELLIKILSATGINADWINAGAITITDQNGVVIFEVSKDDNRVVIRDTAISIGDLTLPEKLDQLLSDISWQADTKVETWYQPSTDDPSLTWNQRTSNLVDHDNEDILDHLNEPILLLSDIKKRDHTGDLWHQTDTNEDYIYQDGEWVLQDISNTVYDLIGEKATIYRGTTHPDPPYYENDLWFTGNEIKVCVHERLENESYVEADWEKKDYYYKEMTPYETWQHLTDNGNKQGIVYDDTTGQLYINGEYISANTLDGNVIKAGTINASKLNIAEGVNLYSNYDTMLQITDDTIAWKKVGVETTGTYAEFVKSPATIINGNYVQFRSTSSSGNHYILLGSAENNYGTIWVQPGYYYRISFYARTTTSGGKVKAWVAEYTSRPTSEPTSGSYNLSGQSEFSLTLNSWTRYEFNYMPPTSPSNIYYIGLGFAATVTSTTINICGIMIERLNTADLAKAQTINTSPFESASITVIDGGNILANTITAKQIGVLGGWTIASTSLYAGNISLNAAGEKVEFTAYDNPTHSLYRTASFIDNTGNCYFKGVNGDVLNVGGDLLDDGQSGGPGMPAIYADSQSASFYKPASFNNNVYLKIYATGSTYQLFVNGDGLISRGSTPQSSSKRYKNHVRELTEDEGELVYKLKPVWFKYKDEFLPENSEIKGQALTGFYAEDILQTMPNVVYYNKEGLVENWRERELIPYLVKTIQNQKKKIDDLEKRLEKLESLLLKNGD